MEHPNLYSIAQCQVCGGKGFRDAIQATDHSVSGERFQIVSCATCGAWFTSPRPGPKNIGAYYQSNSYISHTNSRKSLVDKAYQLVRNITLSHKRKLIRSFAPRGSVLDIGCGTGQFLKHMKDSGYEITGVEPDSSARGIAETTCEQKIHASVDDLSSSQQFDVITMWHVLEHVPDLQSTFNNLGRLISDRGLLFIAIPDRESWDAEHYGSFWAAYDVPRHLSHLRKADVEQLLSAHGYQLLSRRPMYFDSYYIALLSEKYHGHGFLSAAFKAILLGTWSNLTAYFTHRATSSSLYIAQRR